MRSSIDGEDSIDVKWESEGEGLKRGHGFIDGRRMFEKEGMERSLICRRRTSS